MENNLTQPKGVDITFSLFIPYSPVGTYTSQDIASQYQSVLWDKFIPKFNTVGTYLSHLKKPKKKIKEIFWIQ